jgi:hypothetical protein
MTRIGASAVRRGQVKNSVAYEKDKIGLERNSIGIIEYFM